jgi:hypothetical protein
VFVTKLNASGTALLYSTYLGGSLTDLVSSIAVDGAGQAYVTGLTDSTDFPTATPLQATLGGPQDAFVTALSATGASLLYSTYLGGHSDEGGSDIAVDGAGQAYVTGFTGSTDFPTAVPLQTTLGGVGDAFVMKLSATGTNLLYSTYLGGSGDDVGRSIAVDGAGQAYVTGETGSANFPTATPLQVTLASAFDAFVAKITTTTPPTCTAAKAVPAILWSPNHQFVPIAIMGVTDPNGGAVPITVTGVTQDEPVNAKGDGNTSPDAVIQAGAASVRAERSGKGNGRVYELSFKADDGQGGVCTGTVKVSVPHSLHKGATAINDGQIYDSTVP